MNILEIQPGVITGMMNQKEVHTFRNLTGDLIPQLETISETSFLDSMQQRASLAREQLPEVTVFLDQLRDHAGPKVAIIDFPESTIENIPPTPTRHLRTGEINLFEPDIYRGLILGMADWYGYGYTTQQSGVIHNNIVQVKELEAVAGHSASAPHELGLHVEDASYNLGEGYDISPDFLTLHYFRNPTLVPTLISIPEWDAISTSTRDLLNEEWFYNRTNPAQGGKNNNPLKPVSVIYGPQADPWMRLNTAVLDLESYSPNQQAAVREIRDHLEERRTELDVRKGQIAIIDNRRVLHGRPAFRQSQAPRYDGTDRWHRRLVVSNDATRIQRYETRQRVVDPERVIYKKKQNENTIKAIYLLKA